MEKTVREHITSDQRKELVDFIKIHPQLNVGKFTNEFTFKKAQELWETLANNLNTLPGANKDWKKWRKTWQDIKTRTKSKTSTIKQHRKKTGGGPPINMNITSEEEEVLGIMGQVVVDGYPGVQESQVEFDDCALNTSAVQVHREHDYFVDTSGKEEDEFNEIDCIPVPDKNEPPLELPPQSNAENSRKTRFKQPRRVQRLEKTISATAELAKQTERDIIMRSNYYNKKIELYEQDVKAKIRIASALERMVKLKEDSKKE